MERPHQNNSQNPHRNPPNTTLWQESSESEEVGPLGVKALKKPRLGAFQVASDQDAGLCTSHVISCDVVQHHVMSNVMSCDAMRVV